MQGIAIFFAGVFTGVVGTIVAACAVAAGDDNEYMDYPPEEDEWRE